jgi:undecaprenyl pyrophosphate phosphatase UppP
MPKNRLIYIGILIVAATALLYVGYMVTKTIEWFLPWAMGIGVLLIVGGVFMEANKAKAAKLIANDLKPGTKSADNIKETTI